MNIKLLTYTPDPEALVAASARVCYTNKSVQEILDILYSNKEENKKFIERLMSYGHESPLEHISFSFSLEGVSRVLTHQLVRHRIASYSQKSQRYVNETQFEYYTPNAIKKNNEAQNIYSELMKTIQDSYDKLVSLGIDKEDARYVLPNSCNTTIIVTMNARSLLNFFAHRCCSRAQTEIRMAANEMLKQVKEVAPIIFLNAGAACIKLGYCPENSMSCGAKPILKQLISN